MAGRHGPTSAFETFYYQFWDEIKTKKKFFVLLCFFFFSMNIINNNEQLIRIEIISNSYEIGGWGAKRHEYNFFNLLKVMDHFAK